VEEAVTARATVVLGASSTQKGENLEGVGMNWKVMTKEKVASIVAAGYIMHKGWKQPIKQRILLSPC
jgi:hypothetical protein